MSKSQNMMSYEEAIDFLASYAMSESLSNIGSMIGALSWAYRVPYEEMFDDVREEWKKNYE